MLSLPESLADPLALAVSEEELLLALLPLLLPRAELESPDDELPLDVMADVPAWDLCDLCGLDVAVVAVPLFEARLPAHGIAVDAVVGVLGEPRGLAALELAIVFVVVVAACSWHSLWWALLQLPLSWACHAARNCDDDPATIADSPHPVRPAHPRSY